MENSIVLLLPYGDLSDFLFSDIAFAGSEFVEIDPVRKRFAIIVVAVIMVFIEGDGGIQCVNGDDTATRNRVDFQADLVSAFCQVVSEVGATSRHKWIREVGDIFDFKFPGDSRSALRV